MRDIFVVVLFRLAFVCACVCVVQRGWLTKSSPEFYDPILEHDRVKGTGVEHGDLWLLDDSAVNLEVSRRGRGQEAYSRVVACLRALIVHKPFVAFGAEGAPPLGIVSSPD